MVHLEYAEMADWPPSAWLARCFKRSTHVMVYHGGRVETEEEFFCEAVWAGKYDAGDFDRTDIVAGSGGRRRGNSLVFVSSGSTVDRLNSIYLGDCVWVSNSLPCVVSAIDGCVDPSYSRYYEDFYSVVHGLKKYRRSMATSAGDIELTYFFNLKWDGNRLSKEEKPSLKSTFENYADYHGFLQTCMQRMVGNAVAPRRRRPYRVLGTLSSGYDSSAVTALASGAGCKEVICFDRTHKDEEDSGETVAERLRVRAIPIKWDAWRSLTYPEVPFVASNGMGEEVRFCAAESHLRGRVLFTGYHGDKVWGKDTKDLSENLVRGDPSGLSLTEYRLWAGFIHCPVPFWGARQICDIHRINNSAELSRWDVAGDYSRPICRRIVEDSGVPRHLFGTKKLNASVILHNYRDFLLGASMADYLDWIRARRGAWLKRGRLPPVMNAAIDRRIHVVEGSISTWAQRQPLVWRLARQLEAGPTRLRRFIFPWAMEHAMKRYRWTG